jgi:CO dehydrogenase maturation factor
MKDAASAAKSVAGEGTIVKICVCGKGGSGKSTVVALLAVGLRKRGRRVLVLDSDESNAGLYWMLGFAAPPLPLMELAGGRKYVQRALRGGPAEESVDEERPVLARDAFRVGDLPGAHVRWADGVGLVSIGKIHQALEGCACPMGVLSREFLKRLQTDNEVVVVDMEAGVEHFGRGVETSVDDVLVVVEPSLESVHLAERIRELATGAGAKFAGAVLNKVNGKQVERQLTDALNRRGIPVVSTLPFRQEILLAGLEGRPLDAAPVKREAEMLLDSVLAVATPAEGN